MWNEIGIDRQAILVGLGVVVLYGRKIDDDDIRRPDVAVSMPDKFWNVDETRTATGKVDLRNFTIRAGVRPWIVENEFHLAADHEVAVFVQLMQAPALHHPRTNGENVGKDQRIGMPAPAGIIDLGDAAAIVIVSNAVVERHSVDNRRNALALLIHRFLVLQSRCERRFKDIWATAFFIRILHKQLAPCRRRSGSGQAYCCSMHTRKQAGAGGGRLARASMTD